MCYSVFPTVSLPLKRVIFISLVLFSKSRHFGGLTCTSDLWSGCQLFSFQKFFQEAILAPELKKKRKKFSISLEFVALSRLMQATSLPAKTSGICMPVSSLYPFLPEDRHTQFYLSMNFPIPFLLLRT